jgi:Ca-activated chloride channel family protein
MQKFIFQYPEYLWALAAGLPVLALGFWALWWVRRKRLGLVVGKNQLSQMFPGWTDARQILRYALLWLGVAGFLLALARPRYGTAKETSERSGVYIALVLDVSTSMLAEDILPNRLQRAKMAISQLFTRFRNDQVALVVFAGTAHLAVPMTPDLAFAQMALDFADTESPTYQGTQLTEALDQAIQAFPEERTGGAAIILMTDGEDHEGSAVEKAREAYNNNIVVHAMGVGKSQGAPIPQYSGQTLVGYKKDADGNPILTTLNMNLLQDIAQAGGGIAVQGENPTQAIEDIFKEIESMNREVFSLEERDDMQDQFFWFLWPAFCVLLAESLIAERGIPWWKKFGFLN